MGLLDNKTALITGAASGIGAAAARVFTQHGARVILADINDDAGQRLADALVKDGHQAMFIHTDVTDSNQVTAMARTTIDIFGSLDCAFNNAGIDGQPQPLHQMSQHTWDQVLSVNLTGIWLCLKAEISHMIQQGGGAIVNTASTGGLVGMGALPMGAYIAAKHGVVGLTKQAALEYASHNIRVNALCPGAVRTEMVQEAIRHGYLDERQATAAQAIKRLATAGEIAEAAAWLCSDTATFTTGSSMAIDGGWTAQ